MLEKQVLDEALTKKNKEYETLKNQNYEIKKNYDSKIKNLMNSITLLKSEKDNAENSSKDNIRVNIINKLKDERKDQEQIIELLRKLILDEDKVDKFLMKEFTKKGNQRIATYEELKIKIKQLESEIVSLKFKNLTNKNPTNNNNNNFNTSNFGQSDGCDFKNFTTIKNENDTKNNKTKQTSKKTKDYQMSNDNDQIFEIKMAEKFKFEILRYEEKIESYEKENNLLKIAKDKMEKAQNDLFEKLKNYNQEIGELKSIYDIIKKNLEDDCNSKVQDACNRINEKETENSKYKEKINELIEIAERQMKDNIETIKRLNSENDVLRRYLETKKYEVTVLTEEIKKYQNQLENNNTDNKDYLKIRNIEKEKQELQKKNLVHEEKIKHLDQIIMQKEFLLESLHDSIEEKENILKEKELEIDLLSSKMQELEIITMKNYVKNHYN